MQQYEKFWDNFNEELLNNVKYEKLKNEASFSKLDVKNDEDEQFLILMLFIALIVFMAVLYESLLNL